MDIQQSSGPVHVAERLPVVLTAIDGGDTAGVASGWIAPQVAFVDEVTINEGHHGKGVGSKLLSEFSKVATAQGITRLAAAVPSSGATRKLFDHNGWWVESKLPDWVKGEEWVQLRKDLTAADPRLSQLAGWRQQGNSIVETFVFNDFTQALKFIYEVAMVAEAANRYPEIDVLGNEVKLTISSPRLTDADFGLANAIDGLSA